MPYYNGQVTVTSTATLIANLPAGDGGIYLGNGAAAAVYLGGPNVTASGANQGVPLAANGTIILPTSSGVDNALYGIVASTSTTVTYLYPGQAE